MENCTKFGQLILSKIITIVATSCQISRLKCNKFDFGWGYAPDPARELTDPLAELRGPTSKGREGRGGEERERKGNGETGKGKEGEWRRGKGGRRRRESLKYTVTLGEGCGKFSWSKVGGMFQSE